MIKRWIYSAFSKERRAYTQIGITMTAINIIVLAIAVNTLGVSPKVANPIRPLFTNQIHFILVKKQLYKGRGRWRAEWRKWQLSKVVTTLINQAIYSALMLISTPYFLAYLISVALTGIVSFRVAKKYVFAKRFDEQPEPA